MNGARSELQKLPRPVFGGVHTEIRVPCRRRGVKRGPPREVHDVDGEGDDNGPHPRSCVLAFLRCGLLGRRLPSKGIGLDLV